MSNTDDIDLSKANLFADSNHGVFIPQYFATNVDRSLVEGVSEEDYKVLATGPSHEHYWDAWADVLDNAKITDPKNGPCYLHHDSDLWIVPVEDEAEKPETKTVLGLHFHKMKPEDFEGLAGAEEGSWICTDCPDDNTVVLLSPDGEVLYEIAVDQEKAGFVQRDWTIHTVI